MASFSTSSTLKVVLVSTGVLSMALALKLTVPVVSDFIVSEGPSIWTFMFTCLRPPYLYILMNFIIITIVASSKLHHHPHSPDDPVLIPSVQSLATEPMKVSGDLPTEYNTTVLPPGQSLASETVMISGDVWTEYAAYDGVFSNGYAYDANVPEPKMSELNDKKIEIGSDEARNNTVRTSLQRKDSSRFGHRKGVKASPEGKAALGVTKAKRQDTLKSTWKTITEGRAMKKSETFSEGSKTRGEKSSPGGTAGSGRLRKEPSPSHDELNRQVEAFIKKFNEDLRLQRQDTPESTWDSQQRQNAAPFTDEDGSPQMKKSETFSEGSKTRGEKSSPGGTAGSGRLRKEPSSSQDELNRRVEAFIKKFNEEMRPQRLESLRQYQEMMSRGAH